MKNTKGNVTKSGKRIKEERKKRKINQDKVADLIGYAGRQRLSLCENQQCLLEEDHYKILSKEWNIRKEYLMGLDDYRTEEEYENALMYDSMEEFNSTMKYLQTLGLQMLPKYYLEISINDLEKIEVSPLKYENLRSYYSENAKHYIEKRLWSDLGHYRSDAITETIELIGLPENKTLALADKTQKIRREEFIDKDLFCDYRTYIEEIFPECKGIMANISLLFEIKYKDELIAIKDAYDTQAFLTHIDNLCETCIRDLLRY